MAVLKNTVIIGDINVTGEINASKVKLQSGTSSQFLKGDGSVDSNSYATASSLGNYLPLSGGTLTGNLNVNGKIDSTGNHEYIPITLCRINDDINKDYGHLFLGIPEHLDINPNDYELTYVRHSKYHKHVEVDGTTKKYVNISRWHKIKYPTTHMPQAWLDTFPNDIIKFGLETDSIAFSHCGYNYYSLQAFFLEDSDIKKTTDINEYVNMDYENNKIGLPYVFTNIPHDNNGNLRYKTAGRLMNHHTCGLCLMNANGEIVSNVTPLRTEVYNSYTYSVHIV